MATDDDGSKTPRPRRAEPPTRGLNEGDDRTTGLGTDNRAGGPPHGDAVLREGPPSDFVRQQGYLEVAAPEVGDVYEVVGTFGRPGGQAELYLCQRKDGTGNRVVVKLFSASASGDEDPRERFRLLDSRYLAPYVDPGFGSHDGHWWEVTEYFPNGNLRQLAQQQGGALTSDQVKAVIANLSAALTHFHSQNPHVIHRDIKPTNVLVRTVNPLEVVVCDFGSAAITDVSRQVMSAATGTVYYTAPEAAHGGRMAPVAPSRDWWSLGMLIAELATGTHPYQHPDGDFMEDYEYLIEVNANPVPLDHVRSKRLHLLLRGLLSRSPEKRWTGKEVDEWLAGGSPAVWDDPTPQSKPAPDAKPRRTVPPPPGLGLAATDPAALAQHLSKNWRLAGDVVAGNYFPELVSWVQEYFPDYSLETAARALASKVQGVDRTIAEVITRLDPTLPPAFMGVPVDMRSLYKLPKQFASDDVGDLVDVVEKLFSSGALIAYSRLEGHGDLALVEAKWREWCGLAETWFRAVPEAGGMNAETRALILRAAIGELRKPAAADAKNGQS